MIRYEHTQIGYLTICVLFGAAIFVAIIGIATSPDRHGVLINAVIEVILLICAVVFSKLTIKIDGETFRASFAMGLICKKIPLAELAACEPIRIRWWYGWGIHLTPYGWLYNVAGWDAAAIRLRDGRNFALGSDDPHGLAEALRSAIE